MIFNKNNEKNDILKNNKKCLFLEPKIHQKLNKTLLLFVLCTYVLCLMSYTGGLIFFVFSLTASKPFLNFTVFSFENNTVKLNYGKIKSNKHRNRKNDFQPDEIRSRKGVAGFNLNNETVNK